MAVDLETSDMKALYPRLEKGDVVLFCGAGFSVDSKNLKGASPPLGAGLAKILADLAGLNYGGDRETIISLYEEARDYYKNQFLFWLHFGMAYICRKDPDRVYRA